MRQVWEKWTPRVEDYWESFSAPYRKQLTDLIDKHTPADGSVMDFGCGVGVQSFLLRQRRPDVTIYAIDCNTQAQNLTRVLMGRDDKLIIEDTPVTVDRVRQVDTIFSVFTCTYLHPPECERMLEIFCEKSKTLLLIEPTCLEPTPRIGAYSAMPANGYVYPYEAWLKLLGRQVETIVLPQVDLNAITVATMT